MPTLSPALPFALGAALALAIALAALRTGSLTRSGAFAAGAVGTATFGALQLGGAAVLLAFFVSSVGLSRVGKARKRGLVAIGKLGPRDGAQVCANGSVAAICALAALALHDPRYAIAFAGAFAAATADTWGTEVGTLVRQPPRSIFTLRRVETGLSGGITWAGTLAEIAGAVFIAGVAWAVGVRAFGAIALAGVAGALVDSLAGGSLQSLRWCPTCERRCETRVHVCGTRTTELRGLAWIGNDAVNVAATLAGAAVAFALAP